MGEIAAESRPTRFPRRIGSRVESLKGGPWILLEGDYEHRISAPFQAVWEAITSYEAYPGVFGRIEAAEVERPAPGAARLSQRTVVRVAGIAFPSECVLDLAEELGGGRGRVGFRSSSTDGSLLEIGGGWYLEAAGEGTYVRYRLSSLVRHRFPLQAEIMAAFSDYDFQAILRDLEKAALARGFGGAPRARADSPTEGQE